MLGSYSGTEQGHETTHASDCPPLALCARPPELIACHRCHAELLLAPNPGLAPDVSSQCPKAVRCPPSTRVDDGRKPGGRRTPRLNRRGRSRVRRAVLDYRRGVGHCTTCLVLQWTRVRASGFAICGYAIVETWSTASPFLGSTALLSFVQALRTRPTKPRVKRRKALSGQSHPINHLHQPKRNPGQNRAAPKRYFYIVPESHAVS